MPYVCVTYDVLCMHLVPVTINNIIITSIMVRWVAELIVRCFVCSYTLLACTGCTLEWYRAMLKFVGVVGLFIHNIAT